MARVNPIRLALCAVLLCSGCTTPQTGTVTLGTTSDGAAAVDVALDTGAAAADADGSAVADTQPQDALDSAQTDAISDGPDSGTDTVGAGADTPDSMDAAIPACCGDAAPCPSGWSCGNGKAGLGTCKPAPPPGKCWTAADCPAGLQCSGGFVCPCNADCGAPGDKLGQCQGGPVGCCTSTFDCAKGQRCVGQGAANSGVCKPIPAWGGCWDGNDCSPLQKCQGGQVCPCDADCDAMDQIGQCVGADAGCCTGAGVCAAGKQCMPLSGIGYSTCVALAEPGRCWQNSECPSGQTCQGAAFCPCNSDCGAGYLGPGVCTPPPPACTPLKPAWVQEICDAANLVVWDGKQCVGTCLGCCGCEPFCDKTFATMAACKGACGG